MALKDNVKQLSLVTQGTLHHGRPMGKTRTIKGAATYYAMPPNGSKEDAILFFSDAMGINFCSNRLMVDNFAANGYFTVMPDLFRGDSVPLDRPKNWSQTKWFKHHLPAVVEPIIQAVVEEMRNSGVRRIAGVGYSIGAKYLARFMKMARISVAFVGHPTWVEAEDVLCIDRPISIAFSGDGCVTPSGRLEIERILAESSVHHQTTIYSDVSHGFAIHTSDRKYERFAKEQAFLQAVQWLNFYMKEEGSSRGVSFWT